MTTQCDRILLVDDEQAVLDGLCRWHRKHYTLVQACGSAAGLQAVAEDGPFAVVVTDFQMPGMNGTQFLAKAREQDPDMIRVMLTGQADMQTAIDAVNRGQIFRFLSKPCEPEVLSGCLDAALEQFRLRNVERDLLEQTVRGSIEVLADVLALSSPAAFGKATRIRGLVRHIVQHLQLADGWQYETAALLSQIGYISVPDDLLDRMAAGEELPAAQTAMLERHPEVARDLLLKIPRLQVVAEMVYHQQSSAKPSADRAVVLGGRMLAAALDFEEFLSLGASRKQALDALKKAGAKYDKGVLEALASAKMPSTTDATQVLSVKQLRVGVVIQEEVRNIGGNLIVSSGHEVTEGSLQRLRNYAELGQLKKVEFSVHMP
jgi:response regulator RpfG family c-di-GMP phosphodiesterase